MKLLTHHWWPVLLHNHSGGGYIWCEGGLHWTVSVPFSIVPSYRSYGAIQFASSLACLTSPANSMNRKYLMAFICFRCSLFNPMRVADVILPYKSQKLLSVIVKSYHLHLGKSVHWKSSFHRFFIFFHTLLFNKTVGDIVLLIVRVVTISRLIHVPLAPSETLPWTIILR